MYMWAMWFFLISVIFNWGWRKTDQRKAKLCGYLYMSADQVCHLSRDSAVHAQGPCLLFVLWAADTSVTQIGGPSGPLKLQLFDPLKGGPHHLSILLCHDAVSPCLSSAQIKQIMTVFHMQCSHRVPLHTSSLSCMHDRIG